MISLLYVSRAVLQAGREDRQLADILATAEARNPAAGITGALMHMGGCFAQVLEGDGPPLNQLMIDILRDRRHREVRIIEVVPIAQRRFGGWSMAWVPPAPGPRSFLEALAGAGADAQTGEAAAALIDYMSRFAEAPRASL